MIRSAALLARRVAGPPDRLVRSLAVLAMLVVAAAALMAAPRPAWAAPAAGPACSVTSQAVAVLSDARQLDARKTAPEARRSLFDGTDLCPADLEIVGDLGLPRPPVEAQRPRHAAAATYGYQTAAAPASGPDEALHRPPRAA